MIYEKETGGNIVYKVLLVDPDHHAKEWIKRMLDRHQAEFELECHAAAAAEAMSMLSAQDHQLVLISMRASEEEGLQLCGRIREKSRVPIVLIGGRNEFQLARKALYYQVNDYLPDPVSPEEFAASLKTVKREMDEAPYSGHQPVPWAGTVQGAASAISSAGIIDKVKAYVEEALHQNITLKEISHIFHFNYSYLGQKFKVEEKMTFKEYLLQQRMEKAKFLLENTDMKVYEIANEVGYTEMDWFYKKFKTYTGVSANKYRKTLIITA
ncbi:DNA-binding response regulator [Paenibacillus sp. AR247]|nr:DNA-binding response regulator [Paenibacillus sp. AR247]